MNYHHLLYFWKVVRTGSVSAASQELRLSPPTISAQIHRLEESLEEKLLYRTGRTVRPTEVGQVVFRYAEDIFSLGRELQDTLKGRPTGRSLRISIGISDSVPKLFAQQLIEPALHLSEPVQIICREGSSEKLLGDLAVNELDVVIADSPMGPGLKVRAYNHLLGECSVAFFCVRKLAGKYKRGFPKSLTGAPLLIPAYNSAVRRSLDEWFESKDLRPVVVGEFDDHALLGAFGEAGLGVFPAPSVMTKLLRARYGLERIGSANLVRARFYAISVERKLKHPGVIAICDTGRQKLFG